MSRGPYCNYCSRSYSPYLKPCTGPVRYTRYKSRFGVKKWIPEANSCDILYQKYRKN